MPSVHRNTCPECKAHAPEPSAPPESGLRSSPGITNQNHKGNSLWVQCALTTGTPTLFVMTASRFTWLFHCDVIMGEKKASKGTKATGVFFMAIDCTNNCK